MSDTRADYDAALGRYENVRRQYQFGDPAFDSVRLTDARNDLDEALDRWLLSQPRPAQAEPLYPECPWLPCGGVACVEFGADGCRLDFEERVMGQVHDARNPFLAQDEEGLT